MRCKQRKLHLNTHGMALVEALVVLAVFLLISAAMLGLYVQHGRLYSLGQAQFETVSSARGALNGISAYTVQARRVVTSTVIASIVYTTGTSTLALELPAINGSGDIINGVFDYVVFYGSGDTLQRILAPNAASARVGATRLLADNVTGLVFSYDNADVNLVKKVIVSVTSTAGSGTVTEEHHESGEFILRNY